MPLRSIGADAGRKGSSMPEGKSKFLERILDKDAAGAAEHPSFTSERQLTAQAFNLHIERKDGRRSEGFAWSHYVGYRWTDDGEKERLIVLFGMRAIEIEGHHLGLLVREIREGQLNSVRELTSAQCTLLSNNASGMEPVIERVTSYPDFEELFKEIKKGEEGDDTGFARKTRR